MENRTIWIINQTAGKPDSGWGERHYSLAKHWVEAGYTVKIISGSYNHLFINQPQISGKSFTTEKVAPGIDFCWVKIPHYHGGSIFKLWSMMVFAFKTLFLSPKLLGTPSHILVSSMPIFPILTGWYLKKKFKTKKLFFEIRDLWPLTPMYLSGYGKYHPMIVLMRWIERFGYRMSDAIVSLLPNAASYINAISNNPNKFHWISNGIDSETVGNEPISEEIKQKIPQDKFIVGYTGTIGMANALEYLIEASILMLSDKEVHFVLAGSGYLKEELQLRTKDSSNITFINKIQKSQVQSLISHFDICFIGRNDTPLFDYGVASNKYFDYMLAKKPVLESSNQIGSPNQMSGGGITVVPEDPRAIVAGIKELQALCSKDFDNLGDLGYQYVLKYHNFRSLSKKYLKLF